ncbi:RmlC-like cupin [Viridothelium virens]|uniref:RmlC-like cupin n=1 Tax=Viridothelium virens TaxID=1048519 RepID=A0A6A6GVI8_VIRVR|nr:RmlC-like cupin [Viridothelium virens]
MSVPLPVADIPVNFVPAKTGELLHLGPIKMRVLEDGSRTSQRLSTVEGIIPPHMAGPVAHWHEMHDETFYVTKGMVRFTVPKHPNNPEEKHIDAYEGDYVTVPVRAPHTFSNPSDGESRFFCTMTPSFYINYFKLLSQVVDAGKPVTREMNLDAMAMYATLSAEQEGPSA